MLKWWCDESMHICYNNMIRSNKSYGIKGVKYMDENDDGNDRYN